MRTNVAEQSVIDRLLANRTIRPPWVVLDAGHDCAVVDRTALTADTLIEGVHWDAGFRPDDVGYKAVAVSVSDLVATRAAPRWMVLALSVPTAWSGSQRDAWVAGFASGVHTACARFGVYLVGGDVTGMPADGPAVVTATLGGELVAAPRTRAGARPGDDLWVTGWPGLAGAGWARRHPAEASIAALRRPEPPVAFALELGVATAGMDLSDGLGADLPRLCAASGVGAVLDARALPIHPGIAHDPDPLALVLGGGDDYQLLFTAPPDARDEVLRLAAAHHTPVARVGSITAEPALAPGGPVRLVGAPWPAPLFDHFAPRAS